MSPLFVDTGFYLALLSPRDVWDTRAVELSHQVHRLQSDSEVRIVELTRGLFQRGFDLFKRRPDKDWSVTDCVSFVVMDDLGLREVLGADHHFEQAGFTVLLK